LQPTSKGRAIKRSTNKKSCRSFVENTTSFIFATRLNKALVKAGEQEKLISDFSCFTENEQYLCTPLRFKWHSTDDKRSFLGTFKWRVHTFFEWMERQKEGHCFLAASAGKAMDSA